MQWSPLGTHEFVGGGGGDFAPHPRILNPQFTPCVVCPRHHKNLFEPKRLARTHDLASPRIKRGWHAAGVALHARLVKPGEDGD